MSNPHKFKQSIAYWCLANTEWEWSTEQVCQLALNLGIESVELAPSETYPTLKKYNLKCALSCNGMPGAPFMKGLNNLKNHEEVITRTKQSIDLAAEYNFPNVIAFTGYKWLNPEDPSSGEVPVDECFENCVKGLLELSTYAAEKGVTVCLEHLNTRVKSHPMKGHPGYQGDNIDFCADIVRKVNSPNVRLLFDVYHVHVMHGDIIKYLRAHRDVIGHIHTAGYPGRNELDDKQEIYYPDIVAAIREIGYTGYIGHEFMPTREPVDGFSTAVSMFNA
jgi:hydroxypyruvate isomerase